MPGTSRGSSPSPSWLNRFMGALRKRPVLYDEAVIIEFDFVIPSEQDLTSQVSMINYPASITSTMVVL